MSDDLTHDLRALPGMSANRLADYMAASEQGKRTILRSCKYRPRARVVQHGDARESISDWLSSGDSSTHLLTERSETLRSGLQGSQFAIDAAEHNADYIDRFLEKGLVIPSKAQTVMKAGQMPQLDLEGFALSFRPDLLLKRINRRNVPKIGVGFFRYAKGKALSDEVACWQGAISFGYLTTKVAQGVADQDPEHELCVTLDIWTGTCHPAPTNSTYRFNEVKAACAGIVQRWPNIPPPDGAIF